MKQIVLVWVIIVLNCHAAERKPVAWTRNAFSLPESIWSVEALDANGDGKLDLIAMGETKVYALAAPDWPISNAASQKKPDTCCRVLVNWPNLTAQKTYLTGRHFP